MDIDILASNAIEEDERGVLSFTGISNHLLYGNVFILLDLDIN
jgi:hypothetical protein